MKPYQLDKRTLSILSNLGTSPAISSTHGKAAIAQAVSDYYDIPNMRNNDLKGWYRFNREDDVRWLLGEINELFPIPIMDIADLVYMFFTFRYNVAYPEKRMAIGNPAYAALDALGYTASFTGRLPPESFAVDPVAYSTIYNEMTELVAYVFSRRSNDLPVGVNNV